MAKSSAVVSLRLASLPSTSVTASPAHSATAASSVRSLWPAAATASWAARMSCKAKCLRSLRAPQTGTPYGLRDAEPNIRPLQGIGKRDGGYRARRVVERAQHAFDNIRRDERPDPVMDQNAVRGVLRHRPQAIEHGALPRIPACRRWHKFGMARGNGAIVQRLVVRTDYDCHQIDVRRSDKNAHSLRQDRYTPHQCILLGSDGSGPRASSGGDDQGDGLQGVLMERTVRPLERDQS